MMGAVATYKAIMRGAVIAKIGYRMNDRWDTIKSTASDGYSK